MKRNKVYPFMRRFRVADDSLTEIQNSISEAGFQKSGIYVDEQPVFDSDVRMSETSYFAVSTDQLIQSFVRDQIVRPVATSYSNSFRCVEVQKTRYQADGFFDWHHDQVTQGDHRRDLTVVCMLSETGDYEGGELQIKNPLTNLSHRFRLKRCDAVAFPSWFVHRVSPIKRGLREVVVCWLAST